ncbi:MAG TPA: UbiA family prenyltransferase [Nitrososphaerales archaeon]|nr:UbiA family prenyltransferase [Nitrososphaerales archaeon]
MGQLIRLMRIPTLAATAVPMMVGGALAISVGRFSLLSWLDILIVASLMQIATNALNEYGDYRHAVDTVPSAGFAGIIVSGEVRASEVLYTAVACYALAFCLGVALVFERGVGLLVLGTLAILAGVVYSEGPLPVSSTPFGEVLVGVLMGPIEVVAADIAASGSTSALALPYSLPVGLTVASILLANNLRDVDKDREHGRRTIAVLVGRSRGTLVLLCLIASAFLWSVPAFLVLSAPISVFLIWLALPVAVKGCSDLVKAKSWDASVTVIARTHTLVGLLLTVSLLLPH